VRTDTHTHAHTHTHMHTRQQHEIANTYATAYERTQNESQFRK